MMEKKLRRKVLLFPGLTKRQLIECYQKAKELKLDEDFLKMLRKAIDNRSSLEK